MKKQVNGNGYGLGIVVRKMISSQLGVKGACYIIDFESVGGIRFFNKYTAYLSLYI